MKILVTGATGVQAKPVVLQLIQAGHHVRAFTREAAKAADLEEAGAEIYEGDLRNREDIEKALDSMDAMALHLPFFMPQPDEVAKIIVEAARDKSISYIVWNTAGIIPTSPTGNPAYDVRVLTHKLLIESDIPHTILQPTVYAENLLGPWTAPSVKLESKLPYPLPEDYPVSWLPTNDMAKAMVATLAKPQLAGGIFTIGGKQILPGKELQKVFSIGLEREITYHALPPTEFGKVLDSLMGPGSGDSVAKEYQAIWNGNIQPTMHAEMQEVLDILELTFTDMVDWVRQYRFLFEGDKQVTN